ncbi:MAG: hypothetical protein OQK35_07800 [Alphaproteobacteria bacterium]|nr:hypothetical protein [Rhodospirillales bacterium]MCW9046221.1 hypothetical protein [Alphaproteobacteria bacterium]
MKIGNVLFLLFFSTFAVSTATAEEIDHKHQYKACMALTKSKAEDAFEAAIAWRDRGGGDAARHCAAIALINLKHYEDGAKRMEKLAIEAKADKNFKAGLFAQAGQAWLLAGDSKRAREAQSTGLTLNPNSVDLLIDRSQSYAADSLYFNAIDDLNRALEIEPEMADALVFRATAYRYADSLELSVEDLNRALEIDPVHIEALLEKGIVERLKGNKDKARSTWMSLLEIAPGSPAAEAARANLETMDVHKEK